jgi:chromosome segregation ATPase
MSMPQFQFHTEAIRQALKDDETQRSSIESSLRELDTQIESLQTELTRINELLRFEREQRHKEEKVRRELESVLWASKRTQEGLEALETKQRKRLEDSWEALEAAQVDIEIAKRDAKKWEKLAGKLATDVEVSQARLAKLEKEHDEALKALGDAPTIISSDFNPRTQANNLAEGMQRMLNELGTPSEGYPQPVTNAVDIGRKALAEYGKERWTKS